MNTFLMVYNTVRPTKIISMKSVRSYSFQFTRYVLLNINTVIMVYNTVPPTSNYICMILFLTRYILLNINILLIVYNTVQPTSNYIDEACTILFLTIYKVYIVKHKHISDGIQHISTNKQLYR